MSPPISFTYFSWQPFHQKITTKISTKIRPTVRRCVALQVCLCLGCDRTGFSSSAVSRASCFLVVHIVLHASWSTVIYDNFFVCDFDDVSAKINSNQWSCCISSNRYFRRAALCSPAFVRLSVCPSHVSVLAKRLNTGLRKQCRTIAKGLILWCPRSWWNWNKTTTNGVAK